MIDVCVHLSQPAIDIDSASDREQPRHKGVGLPFWTARSEASPKPRRKITACNFDAQSNIRDSKAPVVTRVQLRCFRCSDCLEGSLRMGLFARLSPNHEPSTHICYISAQTHGLRPIPSQHHSTDSTLLHIVIMAMRPRWPLLPEGSAVSAEP